MASGVSNTRHTRYCKRYHHFLEYAHRGYFAVDRSSCFSALRVSTLPSRAATQTLLTFGRLPRMTGDVQGKKRNRRRIERPRLPECGMPEARNADIARCIRYLYIAALSLCIENSLQIHGLINIAMWVKLCAQPAESVPGGIRFLQCPARSKRQIRGQSLDQC